MIIAVTSIAPYACDKGEHTVLYNINKTVYIKTTNEKTEFEITCCGIVCIGEFLTQF